MDIDPLTLEHVARRRKTSTTLRVFSQRSFLVVPLRIVDLCKHALTSVPRFPTSKGLLVAVTDKRYFFSGHGRVLQSQDSHTCQLFTSLHFFCVWRVFLEIRVPILCFPSFSKPQQHCSLSVPPLSADARERNEETERDRKIKQKAGLRETCWMTSPTSTYRLSELHCVVCYW